ncbi:MAG TPA: hypothetical protein VKB55_18365, partial [Nocardioidaceae bacterium]|nr:hypothetical protein [Nocardioidaceae bacterium]
RASAAENWHETTGLAHRVNGRLDSVSDRPMLRSPHGDGALRYVSAVAVPGLGMRYYFEAACADGAHDLRTVQVETPAATAT